VYPGFRRAVDTRALSAGPRGRGRHCLGARRVWRRTGAGDVIMSYQLGSAGVDGAGAPYAGPQEGGGRAHSSGGRAVRVGGVVEVVLTGVVAGGLWFAYQQGLRHGGAMTGAADVPLIRADERPTKIKPEKPGGMEVPDRDKLIYTQKRGSVEHLLPPPEKPM